MNGSSPPCVIKPCELSQCFRQPLAVQSKARMCHQARRGDRPAISAMTRKYCTQLAHIISEVRQNHDRPRFPPWAPVCLFSLKSPAIRLRCGSDGRFRWHALAVKRVEGARHPARCKDLFNRHERILASRAGAPNCAEAPFLNPPRPEISFFSGD
jgi:hypothetical protein